MAAPFYYHQVFYRVEEELRSRLEAGVAAKLPHLQVTIRSAHLTTEGIEIRGLSIAQRDALGPQPELVYVDEALLACRTNPHELLSGEPVITGVTLRRPVLRATRRPDGAFSVAKLFPLPKPTKDPPPIAVENAMIEVFDPLKNPSSTFTLRDINLSIKAARPEQAGLRPLDFEGSLSGDQIQHVEFVGSLVPGGDGWTLGGTVEGLEISPELRASLPEQVSEPLEALASLRAPARMSFRMEQTSQSAPIQFELDGSVSRGRIEDPLLPFPLTDLQANFHCDNSGFQIRDLSTRHGQTVWQVSQLNRQGYDSASPISLQVSGKQVHLDRALGEAITDATWRRDYLNYNPEGEVNVDCTLKYENRRWKPIIHVTCLGKLSFSCHRFPYRLEHARGTLTLQNQMLYVDLTAYSGPQPVTLQGNFANPGPNFTGQIEIQGSNIPFDEKLFAALDAKPKAREVIHSLHPQGTFNFKTTLKRDDPRVRDMHQSAEISVNRCSMNYEKFPYSLNNVQGKIYVRDGQWTFPELVGNNGTGIVTCTNGSLSSSPERDLLSLRFDAANVPLSEELRKALRPAEQQLWDSLQPRGNVNFIAELAYDSSTRKMTLDLRAYPRDDATSIGTSIEPVSFPYRFEKLKGCIHYRDGHAELQRLRAVHGNTVMITDGSCDFQPDGRWNLKLNRLEVERLHLHQGADQDLIAALPETLRRAITELRPTGALKLKGDLSFSKLRPSLPLNAAWDVDLFVNLNSLQAGPRLENIFGRVHLKGSAEGARFVSTGNLFIDSVNYKNFQFTDMLGPLWFDNESVHLGAFPSGAPAQQLNNHLTARLFGGTVSGDCQVRLGNLPQYHVTANVAGADLSQFARENLANQQQRLNGKLMANVDLRGSRGSRTLFGGGDIHVTDADVGQLPVTVALLKITRAKLPDTTAFTHSDIAFRINGEHVALERIELGGDAVSFSGMGELTLDGVTNPIRLEFHTSVGRPNMPILSGMLGEASHQILRIHVDGTLDNPKTRADAFPVATQALERLRPDYDPARAEGMIRPSSARR